MRGCLIVEGRIFKLVYQSVSIGMVILALGRNQEDFELGCLLSGLDSLSAGEGTLMGGMSDGRVVTWWSGFKAKLATVGRSAAWLRKPRWSTSLSLFRSRSEGRWTSWSGAAKASAPVGWYIANVYVAVGGFFTL